MTALQPELFPLHRAFNFSIVNSFMTNSSSFGIIIGHEVDASCPNKITTVEVDYHVKEDSSRKP